ncbi:TetR/AcrR family transcriptional regulator [Pseudonocardia xinjiangensis]|uniref:TetR/AcrR family transcriptional regulator n=1 Tax=Pseudonocardia xinjiangensis TaxID=75289 RepID=UPI003D8DB445
MPTFQRARSEEQRELRRRTILRTVASMLEEMPVHEVSLNELSRRVGLAKSNVLRYFESREAILLELLDSAWNAWVADLPGEFTGEIDPEAGARERAERVAAVLSGSLARRAVLCDLLSAQAGVLEHNVSPDVAARYKRATIAGVARLADLLRDYLPELGDGAFVLCGRVLMVSGAVWTHNRPAPSMLAAYAADPSLEALRGNFEESLRETLAALVVGSLARAGRL